MPPILPQEPLHFDVQQEVRLGARHRDGEAIDPGPDLRAEGFEIGSAPARLARVSTPGTIS